MAKKIQKKPQYKIDHSAFRKKYQSYKYEYIGLRLILFGFIIGGLTIGIIIWTKPETTLANIYLIPANAIIIIGVALYLLGKFVLRKKGFPYD